MLCSKNKDKKSESNSQRASTTPLADNGCVRRTKIKNLKAIHNCLDEEPTRAALCSKNKDKKSESNSQRSLSARNFSAKLCSKNKDKKSESNSQHQIVTSCLLIRCVRRTKIKNLKAIHNSSRFNMSGCIPYRRRPPPVRNMRTVLKKASYGTRRVFRSPPCSKQASVVQKGYSVPETPFYGTDKPCVPGKTS